MASRSRNPVRARSSNASKPAETQGAQGRLAVGAPTAVVDLGSNSVRLVVYEGPSRAHTPIFNEKVMCALGKGVATTGRLNEEGVARALAALKRFRVLCRIAGVSDMLVIATAAARDAANGRDFLARAGEAIGAEVELLSSKREAELAGLGVIASIYEADGVVGDLGGGSLELTDIARGRTGAWASLQLGGLALMDRSGRSPKKAARIVRAALADCRPLENLQGRTFYAVGGTWRALARLHMAQRNYPLHVMHNYVIPARDAIDFAHLVEIVGTDALVSIESVSSQRRPLLAYGAAVMEQIIRQAKPSEIVVSALGVREGLLYERLDAATRRQDPLLVAARDMNVLRSRAPRHGEDLCLWTDAFLASTHIEETPEERRLRHAACLLADIGWRAHPDYRGEQSLNIIAHATFVGIDHPGRAFLALAASYRHVGIDEDVSPQIRALVSARMLDRARILGAAMRVAYITSAATADVLPRTPMLCTKEEVTLTLPADLADLASERLSTRLKQMARLIGRAPRIAVG